MCLCVFVCVCLNGQTPQATWLLLILARCAFDPTRDGTHSSQDAASVSKLACVYIKLTCVQFAYRCVVVGAVFVAGLCITTFQHILLQLHTAQPADEARAEYAHCQALCQTCQRMCVCLCVDAVRVRRFCVLRVDRFVCKHVGRVRTEIESIALRCRCAFVRSCVEHCIEVAGLCKYAVHIKCTCVQRRLYLRTENQ